MCAARRGQKELATQNAIKRDAADQARQEAMEREAAARKKEVTCPYYPFRSNKCVAALFGSSCYLRRAPPSKENMRGSTARHMIRVLMGCAQEQLKVQEFLKLQQQEKARQREVEKQERYELQKQQEIDAKV